MPTDHRPDVPAALDRWRRHADAVARLASSESPYYATGAADPDGYRWGVPYDQDRDTLADYAVDQTSPPPPRRMTP